MNEEERKCQSDCEEEKSRSIQEFGSITTKNPEGIQTMVIAGQIEGHTVLPPTVKATRYEHILPQLVFAEESPEIEGVLFLINTVGGDVEAGLAMAEMISGMRKPTVALVLGGGHSIGIPLAVAADTTLIAPSATMTVHPVRMNGLVLGTPQSFEYLRKMQERISEFVVRHSHISRAKLDEWMAGRSDMATDIGTIVEGAEAVEAGLCDQMGSFSDALSLLKEKIKKHKKA